MKEEYWNTLIQKHLNKSCSEEERHALEAWLEENEVHRQQYKHIAAIDRELQQIDFGVESSADEDWQQVMAQIQPSAPAAKVMPIGRQRRNWLGIAASLLLVAALGWLLLHYIGGADGPPVMVEEHRSGNTTKSITLKDGTEVMLNKSSVLRVADNFNEKDRQVELEGEAYFKVHKDAARPFRIASGEAVVQVLGTAFNLRAYAADEEVELSVEEGHVRFSDKEGKQSLELLANNAATYNKNNHQLQSRSYEPSLAAAWKPGPLIFDNVDFKIGLLSLERRYGVKFKDETGDFDERLTAHFTTATPLQQVFDQFSLLYQLEFRSEGGYIIVSK